MPIRVRTDAATLARSHIGISPATEIVGVVQSRGRHPMPHVRRLYAEARERLPPHHVLVLQALIPDARDHPHVPDFLSPAPHGTTGSMAEAAEGIASTPAEVLADQWVAARAVLESGIAHRGQVAVRQGVEALLDDPLSTGHLSLLGGWTQATVSHHLGVLRRAGLVTGTRQGRAVTYRRTELGTGLLTGSDRDEVSR